MRKLELVLRHTYETQTEGGVSRKRKRGQTVMGGAETPVLGGGDSGPGGRRLRWGRRLRPVGGGDSGLGSARAVRPDPRKLGLQTSNSRKNRPNWLGKIATKLDHTQRQVPIGSKPQITHRIKRSIQGKFGAIFLVFSKLGRKIGGKGGWVESVATLSSDTT